MSASPIDDGTELDHSRMKSSSLIASSAAATALPSSTSSSSSSDAASFAESHLPQFSSNLEATLKEVFPTTDPLEQTEFDPISYINTTFPDESSLVGGKLDTFLGQLHKRVHVLQDSISKDVREHSQTRSHTGKAIQAASTSITDLFGKIALIKEKATQSEVMVQEICRDIRSLDTAKRHLTNTIRALRNLHMLVSAVGQLDFMVTEKQYRLASERLRAIEDLFTLFESYGDVPKIRTLRASVDQTKGLLKEQLTKEFHKVLPSPLVAQEPQCSLMSDACLVVDVLETSFKNDLLNWFTSTQLDEYAGLFGVGKDGGSIDQIERRYSWMKNWFRMYDQRYQRVFPQHWHLPMFVSREFCKMTKIQIHKLLQLHVGKGLDVTVMVNALLATIDFEKSLNTRFKVWMKQPSKKAETNDANGGDEKQLELDEELSQEALVDQIKRKYAKKTDSERQAEEERTKAEALAAERYAATGITPPSQQPPLVTDFVGMISECFTPYMSGFIEMERKNLSDLISQFDREENWNHPESSTSSSSDGGSAPSSTLTPSVSDRFGSSNDLFQYIKNSINRCSKLNKNVTLFNLYNEYRSALSSYCALLDSKLPKKAEGVSLTHSEIILACYIINTCNYVNETLPGLSERVQTIIDQAHKDAIDYSSLTEEFGLCINKSVQILVASMWTKLNKVLAGMTKMPWSTWSSVGDESSYVQQCLLIFKEELPIVSSKLSTKYHPFFCSQIASTFIPRYVDSIYKCRRIGEMGAQQMSLDAHALKNVLLAVPTISSSMTQHQIHDPSNKSKNVVNKTYAKYVNTEMGKAEALLKTLVSPNERLIVTFKALLPKSNIEDLMRIMNLRGLKRTEQEQLVTTFNSTVGPEDQLKLKPERTDKFTSIFSQLRNN